MAQKSSLKPGIETLDQVFENLEAMRFSLIQCVDEGMADLEDSLYNQILAMITDVAFIKTWDDMEELIAQAKVLEQDIASWLSRHGRTSYSLPWPKRTIT